MSKTSVKDQLRGVYLDQIRCIEKFQLIPMQEQLERLEIMCERMLKLLQRLTGDDDPRDSDQDQPRLGGFRFRGAAFEPSG